MSTSDSPSSPKALVYEGFAYRQNQHPSAPWLVSFVASAEEILTWAGIPRRSEDGFIGFQRAYDDSRVRQTKEFFQRALNQSPTALVVGIHQVPSEDARVVRLELIGEQAPVMRCRLVVEYDDGALTADQLVDRVRSMVRKRLEQDRPEVDDSADENETAQHDAEGDESTEENDDEIELGRSLLGKLLGQMEDPSWVADNLDALQDLAKPATLIDGQHRVKGAALCERNVPFTVCAIYDCSWPEQVYQFTVVNYTAKGIPDQFITANAALSLTRGELHQLQSRLVQAGVKVVEYELMRVVQFDQRSAFYEMVNLTERRVPDLIGYKTMVRLAKAWYLAKNPVFNTLLPCLYPSMTGAAARRRQVDRWKSEEWGEFFIDFWSVVKETYAARPSHVAGHTLWQVGSSNLMIAVVLFELQDAFFNHLGQQDEEFFQTQGSSDPITELRTKFKNRARKFIERFPAEFFGTRWLLKSLSIGPGRVALRDAMENFVKTSGKYQYGKSALITGKTSQ